MSTRNILVWKTSASLSRIADKINSNGWIYITLILIVYFLTTYYRAETRMLWFDEIFSLYLSRLPDFSSLMAAIQQGIDFNPPLFYEWLRLSRFFIADETVAIRTPSIIAGGLLCLCLYRFVSIRTNAIGGLVASLFPLVSIESYYATEARPHGIVIGLAALALVCWQSAIDPERKKYRVWWLGSLCLALACATLTHAYAVLAFFPLALAELTRDLRRKHIDWPVWSMFAIASIAVLMPFWLIHIAKTHLPPTFAPATVGMLVKSYTSNLDSGQLIIVAALFLYLGRFLSGGLPQTGQIVISDKLKFDLTACLGFVVLPVIAFILAKIAGTPLYARYSLGCIIGFSAFLGIFISRYNKIGLILIILLAGRIGKDALDYQHNSMLFEPSTGRDMTSVSKYLEHYKIMADLPDPSLPVVIYGSWNNHWDFTPELFYAPAEFSNRLTLLLPEKQDLNKNGYMKLQNCCHATGNISEATDFIKLHKYFFAVIYTQGELKELYRLLNYGAVINLERYYDKSALFSVKVP
ncbi:MAG: glycosyltransferase family 39 protein [Methylococcales bacterium]|nr:glycosyltransferase family 39 protein [Methylococcales bacterium]